jgi:hypothetical protein
MEGRMQDQIEGAQRDLEEMLKILEAPEVHSAFEEFEKTLSRYAAAKLIHRVLCHGAIVQTLRWIPVEERLPPNDDDTSILCFNGGASECWYSDMGGEREPAFRDCECYSEYAGVTHWMPMPDGPVAAVSGAPTHVDRCVCPDPVLPICEKYDCGGRRPSLPCNQCGHPESCHERSPYYRHQWG